MLKIIVDWMKRLTEQFLRSIWSAIITLYKYHPARIGISAGFLIAAIVTGKFYFDRTRQYQDIVSTTVRAEGEDTPQRFKVLEAFIMSTIDTKLSEVIANAEISEDFSQKLEAMHEVLSAPPSTDLADGVRVSIPDYLDRTMSLPLQDAILTDNSSIGFLFFPLNLLRTPLDNYKHIFDESRQSQNSRTLMAAVKKDETIAHDIYISNKLAPLMQSVTKVPLFKDNENNENLSLDTQPVQIYYITKNGLNRIVNNNTDSKKQQVVYRNMFRSTTFFPSRPYYINAFKPPSSAALAETSSPTTAGINQSTLADIKGATKNNFYVSKPYLDIGGFGVVITLARSVSYMSHSEAAICFDLRVQPDNDTIFHLRERLESFGAAPQEFKCKILFQDRPSCEASSGSGVNYRLRKKLEDSLQENMRHGDLSKVLGNISILDEKPKGENVIQAGFFEFFSYPMEIISGYNSRPITFAIPLDSPSTSSDGLEVRFMISSLNLDRFQEITSLFGFVSVLLLALVFFLILLSWQSEMQTRHSYEKAFKIVDSVLYGALTPYCRLNGDDEIVDCNTAFCDLLKMPADTNSVESIKGKTFESLVALRSKTTYQAVQERRKAGKEVSPYTLYFTCTDGSEVETRVTSGVIPSRAPRELPETFGIMIPAPN